MHSQHNTSQRLTSIDKKLDSHDGVAGVQSTEEFIPPHKSAGFLRYDAVVFFKNLDATNGAWTKTSIKNLLEQSGVTFAELLEVSDSASCDPGDIQAYVSLTK